MGWSDQKSISKCYETFRTFLDHSWNPKGITDFQSVGSSAPRPQPKSRSVASPCPVVPGNHFSSKLVCLWRQDGVQQWQEVWAREPVHSLTAMMTCPWLSDFIEKKVVYLAYSSGNARAWYDTSALLWQNTSRTHTHLIETGPRCLAAVKLST